MRLKYTASMWVSRVGKFSLCQIFQHAQRKGQLISHNRGLREMIFARYDKHPSCILSSFDDYKHHPTPDIPHWLLIGQEEFSNVTLQSLFLMPELCLLWLIIYSHIYLRIAFNWMETHLMTCVCHSLVLLWKHHCSPLLARQKHEAFKWAATSQVAPGASLYLKSYQELPLCPSQGRVSHRVPFWLSQQGTGSSPEWSAFTVVQQT